MNRWAAALPAQTSPDQVSAWLTGAGPALLADAPAGLDETADGITPATLEWLHARQSDDHRATGRVYTPAPLAAFMARAALDGWSGDLARLRVVDPACGCGALLVAIGRELLARGLPPSAAAAALHGCDLDARAVAIARFRLRALLGGEGRLLVADALAEATWTELGSVFDVAIANPPYVRQERLSPAAKAAVRRRWGGLLGGTCDLAAAFYLLGWDLLAPDGVHLYLGTDSWLDAAWAAPLRRLFAEQGQLTDIWELAEAPFAEAEIHAVVSRLRRTAPHPTSATTSFHRADTGGRAAVARAQHHLAHEAHWAGSYLRAPEVYGQILAAAGDRLVPLAELANLRRGWSTGANEFFYVQPTGYEGDRARVQLADGGSGWLPVAALGRPVLVKAGQVGVPCFAAAGLPHRLLRLTDDLLDDPDVRAWLARAEMLGLPQRPSLAARRPWYAADQRPPAVLCLPIGHKRRPVLAWPEGGLVASDNFLEIRPHDPAHTPLLAASLLSGFAMLAYEALGRANFGQGLLKTQVYELAELPVLDPRALPANQAADLLAAGQSLVARAPEIVYNEVRRPDRQAFDAAWLAGAGATVTTVALHDALCRTVWRRQSRADLSRESRQTYDAWLAEGQPF